MGKAFGIIAIVLAVWFAMELYTEGVQNAFGGAVAFLDSPQAQDGDASDAEAGDGSGSGQRLTLPQRAGARVERAHAEAFARREALMGD
jgi:hypothetical protein